MAEVVELIVGLAMSAFFLLSLIMAFIAPLFSFVAYCDLKDGRKFPWIVHIAGFFGLFSFVAAVDAAATGTEFENLSVYLQVPAYIGVLSMWMSCLYMSITGYRR